MSPVAKPLTVSGVLRGQRSGRLSLLVCSLWIVMTLSACGSSDSGSVFDSDAGRHALSWADPFSIGRNDFHAGPIKNVQSSSRGAVLFGMRCGICHGNGGIGKIGPDIRGANGTIITGAIAFVPLMKGQADLTPVDIQDVAAYLATLLAGAQPAFSIIQTENCTGCHGGALEGGIARVSCFSCHNGPDGVVGHPAAWSLPATNPVNFHGSYGRKFSSSCTTCHGVNFEGAIGRSCASCHNGTIAPVLDFIPVPGQPGGQAVTIITTLSGTQEVPPTVTAGSGTATLTIDLNTGSVGGAVTFTGLSSSAVAAHIHQGAAGVNGPVILPFTGAAGVTSGTWTLPAGTFLTASQLAALKINGLYVNIHTVNDPAGEIRGQIDFP